MLEIHERTIQYELLRFAVMESLTCPYCGHVLDVRQSVLIGIAQEGHPERNAILCADCWDARKERTLAYAQSREQRITLEITDGREYSDLEVPDEEGVGAYGACDVLGG
jgi:hypothetical protein